MCTTIFWCFTLVILVVNRDAHLFGGDSYILYYRDFIFNIIMNLI
jgi:hypothetical protein